MTASLVYAIAILLDIASKFFLAAVVLVEQRKFDCLDLIAARAPSIAPKGILKISGVLKLREFHGEFYY